MSRETIRDRHNQIIAYYHYEADGVIRVTDAHQQLLGRVKHNGTFDSHNALVSHQREPGLLLPLDD
ncbi:MAG: hypothetical protein NTW87_11600 [Planctomycetota bacterium]|nr:hypothetical protein [Planctomycetota bacterium]